MKGAEIIKKIVSVLATVFNLIIFLISVPAIAEIPMVEWQFPYWVAYPLAVTFVIVFRGWSGIAAICGAMISWQWPWWEAIAIFLWPLILTLGFGVGGLPLAWQGLRKSNRGALPEEVREQREYRPATDFPLTGTLADDYAISIVSISVRNGEMTDPEATRQEISRLITKAYTEFETRFFVKTLDAQRKAALMRDEAAKREKMVDRLPSEQAHMIAFERIIALYFRYHANQLAPNRGSQI